MIPGFPTNSPGPFELSGGALCLDFANTWSNRGNPTTDHLGSYGDLLAFSRQAGALDRPLLERLARVAETRSEEAVAALEEARGIRESLFRILSARAVSRPIEGSDLSRLDSALRDAHLHLRLVEAAPAFVWSWEDNQMSLRAPLWPISRSAAALMTSTDLARVRECAGTSCTWLFLDRSRGRSRRWCSMESCGNRAKASRHYLRNRSGG